MHSSCSWATSTSLFVSCLSKPTLPNQSTLLIFSLQKLKVFTVSQIPLHFHCVFYSHPLHAVDHCTHFGLQLKPAFFANPLPHFLPFIYCQNYMFSTANLAFIHCTFIKKWNQICQKKFQKKFPWFAFFVKTIFCTKYGIKKICVHTGIRTWDPSHSPPASSRLSPLGHLTFL